VPGTPDPRAAAAFIRAHAPAIPALAVVLGSGFQHAVARIKVESRIPFACIPGFSQTRVHGHAGELIVGRCGNAPVLLLCGRVHYYEGHSLAAVTLAIRVLAELGVRDVLLTNAAGGIARNLRPGDFMVLTDHINWMGANPLRGPVTPGQARFVDLTAVYDAGLRSELHRAAKQANIRRREGIYLAVSGPSYETPAEIEAFARLGADAVGMSTVPEAIVARQCGLRVAGLSCITNLAAGRGGGELSHAEVLATGEQVKEKAAQLLENFVRNYEARYQTETRGRGA
jgi:purine-nucleoside phosphorylase